MSDLDDRPPAPAPALPEPSTDAAGRRDDRAPVGSSLPIGAAEQRAQQTDRRRAASERRRRRTRRIAAATGRLLLRLVVLAAVAAAGIVGWFGAERLILADGTETAETAVWPVAYVADADEWANWSATDGVEPGGGIRVDAGGGIVKIWPAGGDGPLVEIAAGEGTRRSPDGTTWTPLTSMRLGQHLDAVVRPLAPARATDLVSGDVAPFATVGEAEPSVEIEDAWDHAVVIDVATMLATSPLVGADHVERWGLEGLEVLQTTITVDDEGWLLRRADSDGSTLVEWVELDTAPRRESSAEPSEMSRYWDVEFVGEGTVAVDVATSQGQFRDDAGRPFLEVEGAVAYARSDDEIWERSEQPWTTWSVADDLGPLHLEDLLAPGAPYIEITRDRELWATGPGTPHREVVFGVDRDRWTESGARATTWLGLVMSEVLVGQSPTVVLDEHDRVLSMLVDGDHVLTWRPRSEPIELLSPLGPS